MSGAMKVTAAPPPRAVSAASPSSLNDVSATTPPRRANVIVGQIATA